MLSKDLLAVVYPIQNITGARYLRDTTYDTESFPNYFSATFKHADDPNAGTFEISSRRNDAHALASFVTDPRLSQRHVGFNNIGYDYPLVHQAVSGVIDGRYRNASGEQIAADIYATSKQILATTWNDENRWRHQIPQHKELVPQLDLMKVHHLDNRTRLTGLKALEFAMRSASVMECPVPFDTVLTPEQMDTVTAYGRHDVFETDKFREKSKAQIEFRDALGRDWWNLSDTSIGKRFFRERLEERKPGCTGFRTERYLINLADIIFPYIQFRYEPFRRQLDKMRAKTVLASEIKGTDFGYAMLAGFKFEFGSGGLHGSVMKQAVRAGAGRILVDIDVTSYYPTLAIRNRFYPLHLGEIFCDIYGELFDERKLTKKGAPDNIMLKFALNGVFGDSNNPYSRGLFDPAYTLTTTINGQLLLAMLAEQITDIPGARLIQANTDGLTVDLPAEQDGRLRAVCAWWEAGTGLQLERKDYSRMWIRDVNNYVAEDTDGKRKRKGAYEYELEWWQDPSALAVPRAAEAAMVHGADLETFLRDRLQRDPWDFMLRAKVPKASSLWYGHHARPEEIAAGVPTWQRTQNLSRYYMSTTGEQLMKVMPPAREISVQKGERVRLANVFDGRPPADVNIDWYVKEARKLVIH